MQLTFILGGEVLSFLLSSRSSFMTGEAIRADGMVTTTSMLEGLFNPNEQNIMLVPKSVEEKSEL